MCVALLFYSQTRYMLAERDRIFCNCKVTVLVLIIVSKCLVIKTVKYSKVEAVDSSGGMHM